MITASPQALANHPLVPHAWQRMQQRGIAPALVEQVLRYGRVIYARGLCFRVVGRREVDFFAARGINLRAAEGIHVLVQPDGSVLTTYRNHDLRAYVHVNASMRCITDSLFHKSNGAYCLCKPTSPLITSAIPCANALA